MKNVFYLIAVSAIGLMACKKESERKMIVVKDCTGSYLRAEGKDYHVCNTEKIAAFEEGRTVMASYKKVNDCAQEKDKIVCMMYHENEGWIEITKVK